MSSTIFNTFAATTGFALATPALVTTSTISITSANAVFARRATPSPTSGTAVAASPDTLALQGTPYPTAPPISITATVKTAVEEKFRPPTLPKLVPYPCGLWMTKEELEYIPEDDEEEYYETDWNIPTVAKGYGGEVEHFQRYVFGDLPEDRFLPAAHHLIQNNFNFYVDDKGNKVPRKSCLKRLSSADTVISCNMVVTPNSRPSLWERANSWDTVVASPIRSSFESTKTSSLNTTLNHPDSRRVAFDLPRPPKVVPREGPHQPSVVYALFDKFLNNNPVPIVVPAPEPLSGRTVTDRRSKRKVLKWIHLGF